MNAGGVAAVAASTGLPSLRELHIAHAKVGVDGARVLADAESTARLETLARIHAEALLGSKTLRGLAVANHPSWTSLPVIERLRVRFGRRLVLR